MIDAFLEPPDDIVNAWDPLFDQLGHLIFNVGVVMTSACAAGHPRRHSVRLCWSVSWQARWCSFAALTSTESLIVLDGPVHAQ